MEEILCIIPARRGSKNKNMWEINGKPLIGYSIDDANNSKLISHIVVSSDGDDILDYAKKNGIYALKRPDEISGDKADLLDAYKHAVLEMEKQLGKKMDIIVCIMANVPMRPDGVIDKCISLVRQGFDSGLTIFETPEHVDWLYRKEGDHLVYAWQKLMDKENVPFRRQDLNKYYRIDGSVIAVRRDILMNAPSGKLHTYFGKKMGYVEQEHLEALELHDEWEIKLVNALMERRCNSKEISFGNMKIGKGHPIIIVAELSANHLQNYELAEKTIRAMKKAGADAVKLQTYTPDTMTIDCDNDKFTINQGTVWDGKNLHKLYQEAYTPWEWQPKLKKLSEELGMICFSTPFDKGAVDFLEKMDVPFYKVASFEIVDIPLIEYIASKGKPVIIATGIAEENDIMEAVDACRRMGNNNIILLKCTSAYPASMEDVNLLTMADMEKKFGCIVGISDHTMGSVVPIASVSLGARMIEKHFILDRKMGGPDSAFSMEPSEFRAMVDGVRAAEKAIGNISYELTDKMKNNRKFARSIFVVKDVKTGEIFTEENIRSIRPGDGMPPKNIKNVLGKKARKDIKKGTPLSEDMF